MISKPQFFQDQQIPPRSESRSTLLDVFLLRGSPIVVELDEVPSNPIRSQTALPERLEIAALRDGRFRVLSPIVASISRHDEMVIAHVAEIDEYGQGASLGEAIEDLQRGVAELFLTLRDEREALGPDLERVHQWLQERIEVRSPEKA